jgi:hypothetical protein
MPDKIDLTGPVADAFAVARRNDRPVIVGAVDGDGNPQVSFRGSTFVYSPDQLAIWVRKRDSGLASYIALNPNVTVLYYDPEQRPDPATCPRRVVIKGRARVEPSLNDDVYDRIVDLESERDPERKGIAVIIDVDSVAGFGGGGPIKQAR